MMQLAARQHGVVTTAQLAAVGLGRGAVAHRVREGRLRRLHRGVYLVGPVPLPRTFEAAALLAAGPGALLSHATAAALWELPMRAPEPQRRVDVIVPGRAPSHRPGIHVHRVHALDRRERSECDGLPITAPGRTLLDVAAFAGADLDRSIEHALIHGLESRRTLGELLDRHRGDRGARALRTALDALADPQLTRSEAERQLLALVRAAQLPEPAANVRVAGHEVDLLWREQRLVVEVDGFAYHGGRAAFERDRRRDADLVAARHRVLRVTWRQLTGEREAVAARIAAALAAS